MTDLHERLIGETDAQVWAKAFVETATASGYERVVDTIAGDEGAMIGWFACAIMAGYDSTRDPLKRLAAECHATSVNKGFYEPVDPAYLLKGLELMLEVCSISNRLEALRKNIEAPVTLLFPNLSEEQLHAALKLLLICSEAAEAFVSVCTADGDEAEEIADIFIRLADYVGWRGINLDVEVAHKMEKNAGRPHKHNCNF